jgi:uncharacterized protein YndB with AHSA1/START domain
MTIAPVRHSVEVNGPPARAFQLFTSRMGGWWPGGRTPAANPAVDVVVEPHEDGRWYEVDEHGNETQWGKVVAWEPPHRLVLGWQLGRDWHYEPDLLTEVEITFVDANNGKTLVALEHRNLERFGDYASERRAQVDGGWPSRLADFRMFSEAKAEEHAE